MDGSRFDTLARAVAQSGTRRRLVGLLLALPLGGVLAIADEAGEVVAERPLDRVQRRTPQRTRKKRNTKNNRRGQDSDNRDPNNRPCSSSADCQKGRTCCRGTCCQPPANQCNLEGMCCAPNCAGRTCGTDGCGKGGTCGNCGVCQTCTAQGTCQPVTNGTECGTSSHGGSTLRCCNGACPDPDCTPGGEHDGCPGPCGVNGQNCCSGGADFCLGSPPSRCFCTFYDFTGMRCGSDTECERSSQDPPLTACICGTCQVPPAA
jgi:hypothetical protein